MSANNDPFLYELEAIVQQRLSDTSRYSYTAKLAAEGIERVAQKVGEEAVEVAIASVGSAGNEFFRNEVADLIFHLLVLLAVKDVALDDVVGLLRARHESRQTPD